MKKRNLALGAAAVVIALVPVYCFCCYHTQPKLVKELAWSPEQLDIAPAGVIYGNDAARNFFARQKIAPHRNLYYTQDQWQPLILRGRKIKKLYAELFSTDKVTLEFAPGDPDTLYCYYVPERYNNFLSGIF